MNISCLFLGRQLLAIWLIVFFIQVCSLQEEINAKLIVQLDAAIIKASSKPNTNFRGAEWGCWVYCCKYRVFLCMNYRPDFHIYSLLLSSQSRQLNAWFDLVNVYQYVLCKLLAVWDFYCTYLELWNYAHENFIFFRLGTGVTWGCIMYSLDCWFCGESRVWMVFSFSLCFRCGWCSFGAITVKSREFLPVPLSEEQCWIWF